MICKLLCGGESKERLDEIIWFTNIRSLNLIEVLHLHFVDGMAENYLPTSKVSQSNFNRAVKNLNEVNEHIEKVKEIDYRKQRRMRKKVKL